MAWPRVIRANCPDCGQIELGASDVELIVCVARPVLSEYSFSCPACHMKITKRAAGDVVSKLMSVGVTARSLDIPAEILERHDGPLLTADDLLDLHEALESPDVWAELNT